MILKGLVVCTTGKVDGWTRYEVESRLQEMGASVSQKVRSSATLLVLGDRAITKGKITSKLRDAIKHGAPVVTWNSLLGQAEKGADQGRLLQTGKQAGLAIAVANNLASYQEPGGYAQPAEPLEAEPTPAERKAKAKRERQQAAVRKQFDKLATNTTGAAGSRINF